MSSTSPKVTLDTNCIINLFDQSATTRTSVELLEELIRQALSNKLEIAVTTRVEADISNDRNDARRVEMLSRLRLLPIVGSVFRLDVSRLDAGDMLAGDDMKTLATEIQRIIFPGLSKDDRRYWNKVNDIDHLVGHKINKRDLFVTDDGDILRKHGELRSSLGIAVMSPKECLDYLTNLESRRRSLIVNKDEIPEKYHSPAFSGRASFDYSNNDGRYFIGSGQHLFETRWSKAGKTSIYAYSDGKGIDSLALAKGTRAFEDIKSLEHYDFSSRARCPEVSEIVIWRNMDGATAYTKIIDILNDDRCDEVDQLSFDYMILFEP